MADNSIKRDPNLLYNNIEEQRLLYNNQLSLQDWNRIINELKTQANVNTKYLEQFIEWFMHGDAKYLELPTDESFVDYILDLLNYINSNYFHPDSTVEGEVVQAVSCETVELLRHEMEYSIGDTIPIVTSENYQGPRDSDIPTTQLMRNLIDDALNNALVNKADKKDIPTKLSQLEQDVGVISLGEIGDPNDANNEILNAVTDSGVYTFTTTESYSGGYYVNTNVYFMVVERTDTEGRAVEQFIYSCDVPRDHTSTLSNLTIIRRIKSKTSGTWVVKSIVIPSQEYVDKKIAKLISEEIDSSPEILNTLKELSEALNNDENFATNVLNKLSAISNISNGEGEGSLQSIGDTNTEGSSEDTAVYEDDNGDLVFNYNADFNTNAASEWEQVTGTVMPTAIPYGATGHYAQAIGGKASAQGKRSRAEGTTTIAYGDYSHAEGNTTVALGGSSHAEGLATVASGNGSHSGGNKTIASGDYSFAMGNNAKATGKGATSLGNNTNSSNDYSFASGHYSTSSGIYSFTANQNNKATADNATAFGKSNKAIANEQFVVGRYNKENKEALFIVGNGTGNAASARSNVVEISQDKVTYYEPITISRIGEVEGDDFSTHCTITGSSININGVNGELSINPDMIKFRDAQLVAPNSSGTIATQDYVDNAISSIPKFNIQPVTTLPTSNISTTTVYLLQTNNETSNLYEEYIYVNNKWELLGTAKVDLSDYSTIEQMETYANTKVPIINTLDGVLQPNIAGKTNWNLWDTFVFTYSPNAKNASGNLIYGGVPKLMKVSQGWDPASANSTNGLTIVQRTANGTIATAHPIANNDAATKKYVDDLVGNIQTLLEAI